MNGKAMFRSSSSRCCHGTAKQGNMKMKMKYLKTIIRLVFLNFLPQCLRALRSERLISVTSTFGTSAHSACCRILSHTSVAQSPAGPRALLVEQRTN